MPPTIDGDEELESAPDTIPPRALNLPLAFIIVSLILLVLLPAPVQRRTVAVEETMTRVIVPARLWFDELEIALTRQASASRAYAATGDRSFLAELEEMRALEAEAEQRLRPLAAEIGEMPAWLDEVVRRSTEWRRLQEGLLAGQLTRQEYLARLPAQDSLHRETLNATAEIARQIEAEQSRLEQEVASAREIQFFLTVGLGILALASAFVVIWLGRRLRLVAATSEQRRLSAVEAGREARRVSHDLGALLESATEGIYGLDLDGRVTFVNRAGADILGYSPDELMGERIHDLIHHTRESGRPYPWSECPVHHTLEEGRTIRAEAETHWRKDGTTFLAAVGAAPIIEEGRIRGAVVSFTDVTERRRRERAQAFLAEASRLLSVSLELGPTLDRITHLAVPALADFCAVHILEEDDRVRRIAQAHRDPERDRALAGTEPESKLDREDEQSILARVVRTGRSVLIVDAEGTSAREAFPETDTEALGILAGLEPRSILAVPLITRGRIRGVLSLVIDESRRHYGPDDIELFEELGRRAATAIDNASLFEETRRALFARERVLGIVSHDLRNPLNTILLSAGLLDEMLPEAETSESVQEQLEIIRRAVERANRLIRDLLDVARLEAETLHVECEPAAPDEIAKEAVALHRALAEARKLTLTLNSDKSLPLVNIDHDRIVQALSNLIGNAIEYTHDGGRIDVRVERAGDRVRYSVRDTGEGIAEEDLETIFDPFWQATRGKGGAGLGLSIVKGIVDAHGGRLHVESRPGKGSTFSFTVPVVAAREGRVAQAAD